MFELSVVITGLITLIIASIEPLFKVLKKQISLKWNIIIIFSLFVSYLLSTIFTIYLYSIDKEDAIKTAYLAQDHPLPHIYKNTKDGLYIKAGSNAFLIEDNITKSGLSVNSTLYMRTDEKGEAFLNCVIRDKKGKINAQLHDSRLINEAGSKYDLNFDEDAYEIVDHNGDVVIQIIRDSIRDTHCYNIQYLLLANIKNKEGIPLWEKCDNEGLTLYVDTPKLQIIPLFKYPGYKNIGVRK